MKRQVITVLGITFALPLMAIAANFSGDWVRDPILSEQGPNLQYWTTREAPQGGGGGRGQANAAPAAGAAANARGGNARGGNNGRGGNANQPYMTVKQTASAVEVSQSDGGAPRKFTLDGKPMATTMSTGIQKAMVSGSVQGETIVVSSTQPWGGMPGNTELQVKEVWSLSPDGKTLTISTTRSGPAQTRTWKQVYTKKM